MKHKEIKGSDKIFTLNISEKFDSLNEIFRVKREIGKIRKGVGNRSGFQDQSKFVKIKKQDMPSQMSARRNFRILSKSLRKLARYLM